MLQPSQPLDIEISVLTAICWIAVIGAIACAITTWMPFDVIEHIKQMKQHIKKHALPIDK